MSLDHPHCKAVVSNGIFCFICAQFFLSRHKLLLRIVCLCLLYSLSDTHWWNLPKLSLLTDKPKLFHSLFSSEKSSDPLVISVAFIWTLSSMSLSLFYWPITGHLSPDAALLVLGRGAPCCPCGLPDPCLQNCLPASSVIWAHKLIQVQDRESSFFAETTRVYKICQCHFGIMAQEGWTNKYWHSFIALEIFSTIYFPPRNGREQLEIFSTQLKLADALLKHRSHGLLYKLLFPGSQRTPGCPQAWFTCTNVSSWSRSWEYALKLPIANFKQLKPPTTWTWNSQRA